MFDRRDTADAAEIHPRDYEGAIIGRHRMDPHRVRSRSRLMMRPGGRPTDISHDVGYTDWDAVERFGREFAGLLGG